MRMLHENEMWEESVFVTLTYSDNNLPPNSSLKKKDLQHFFKRLRSYLEYNDGGRKIRYYACGEYGDQTQRPHYHAIIFGLSLKDKKTINSNWTMGNIHYGLVEPDSIRYVAQYIDKKYTGDMAEQEYKNKHREPVFKISSQGIGKSYADKYASKIANNGLTVNGIKQSIPRYYINRLGLDVDDLRIHAEEAECKMVDQITGNNITIDDAYLYLKPEEVMLINDEEKKSNRQKESNYIAQRNLTRSKI